MNQPAKIILYCHNHLGLGHIVRSARIAEGLLASGSFSPVLLTGCRVLDAVSLPQNVPVERLEPIPLDIDNPDRFAILANRAAHIRNFIRDSKPEMVLVDTLPFGYAKELNPALQEHLHHQSSTIFVLGAPYPPDGGVADMLRNPRDRSLLSAYRYGIQYSDKDWGNAFDGLPFELKKVGEILGRPPATPDPSSKTILVIGGGGTVSVPMLEPVIRATEKFRQSGYHVKFVTGPLADIEKMESQLNNTPHFQLVATSAIEDAVADACLVIARCGYNSALALIQTPLPLIFIPYGATETGEQFERAQNLSALKNVAMINTLKGDYAQELSQKIETALAEGLSPRLLNTTTAGLGNTIAYLTSILKNTAPAETR